LLRADCRIRGAFSRHAPDKRNAGFGRRPNCQEDDMKTFVTAALLAAAAMPALALPGAAQAQSREELRRDRQDIREEQRDLNRAYRSGDPRRIREERRDVREAHQEFREDLQDRNRNWRNDDWRGWRNQNRGAFARGSWSAPFRYTRFRAGARIGSPYYGSRYVIADPWRYHLPRAGRYESWVRHYNDVLLVDTRRGVVIRTLPGFYW
jgi:Ni/Co efflux regulator RcnB